MSIARHHTEWLSLVPVSGPFLSLPVLMEAFNAGLEPHDPDHVRLLRQEFTVWQEASESRRADPVRHQAWIRFVLSQTLDLDDRVLREGQGIAQTLQVEVPEHHELLRPSFVVADPLSGKPRLLIQTYPRSQDLSSYVTGSSWKASPDTRMTELLHGTGVRLGLVTNGEHWMLVDAPKGETSGYASWYASLWLDEPITLRAFRSLLSVERFFGVADDQTLESLLAKSASNQQEVTDQLGYQVRKAVEVLIHSLDKADQDFGRELLADVTPEQLYESALTVMMRLVFLFCAEERELIPSKPFPVYEQNYSVCTISRQLRELADQHGEELLERRYDAWQRLLAAFRAVYGGLQHNDIHIPAYGGSLFNPDRFPFLEGRKAGTTWRNAWTVGRGPGSESPGQNSPVAPHDPRSTVPDPRSTPPANPLPVNNRTVLHLLEALQLLQIKVPGGGPAEARRVSFRALDIEQIGHVYEGLLDHTAKRAAEHYLGLAGTRDKEPEIKLAELEREAWGVHREPQSEPQVAFWKWLKEHTGRSESALKKAFSTRPTDHDPRFTSLLRTACQSDDALLKRVEPLAGLLRLDNFGYPVVIPQGSVFVTSGTDRRSSGTHYTPRSLTEPIVQYTLEPLVYIGPAEGLPKSDWKLKSAKELLALKICDMACGSGAFLVQATRYMAERLLEAWELARQANADTPYITPEGEPSAGGVKESLIPDDPAERKLYAMRLIAQRCIYGVDKNPLAVEMAKLSLWLLTMAKDKPFEFLDHSIRSGDSLVGLHSIDQLRHFSLKPDADDAVLFRGPLDEAVDEAIELRLRLEDLPANTVEDVQRQEQLLAEANEKIARLRCAADLLVAAEYWGENAKDKMERVRQAAVKSGYYVENGPTEEFERVAREAWTGNREPSSRSTDHGPRTTLSPFHWPLEFPEVIIQRSGFDAFIGNPPFLGGKRISTLLGDAVRKYLDYAWSFASSNVDLCGYFHLQCSTLLRTSGCYGLISTERILTGDSKSTCIDVIESQRGSFFSIIQSMQWPGDASVTISILWFQKSLTLATDPQPMGRSTFYALKMNNAKCFVGCAVQGMGFVLEAEDYNRLLPAERQSVVRPFLVAQDLNTTPECLSKRQIIFFAGMELDEAEKFPNAISIVRERVKPYRDSVNRKAHRDRWWRYGDWRPGLYSKADKLEAVFVVGLTSKHLSFAKVSSQIVFDQTTAVVTTDDMSMFAVLSSTIHQVWALEYGANLGGTPRYNPSRCFEPFPFTTSRCLRDIGFEFDSARRDLMVKRKEGLTKTYNRLHDPDETTADIQKLRDLHVEMDQAVAAAYGWTDLDLGHGFHETRQGVRFTISEPARREVLQRLLKLNHERYAEEVKQGLHGKKGGAGRVAGGGKSAGAGGKKAGGGGKGAAKKADATGSKKGPSLFDDDINE